jgi:DNA repair protein RadD
MTTALASTLRDYQKHIAADVESALPEHRRIVVCSPTGSGKTITAIDGIAPILPRPILWITHRQELRRQVEEHNAPVRVEMIQSFSPVNRRFGSVIIDEGHHCCASDYRLLFKHISRAVFVALTATPYRMDGVGLGSCGFTKIIYGPDIHDLTQLGHLCPARTLVPEMETRGSWNPTDCAAKIAGQNFNKAIVYGRTIADCLVTEDELNRVGISSVTIHGSQSIREREQAERAFRSGSVRVVCNHTVFTEGYDAPAVDLVVLNRLTESRCLWRQMTGRGLRLSPGKKLCTILDLAGNAISHGSIYDKEICDLHGEFERAECRAGFEMEQDANDYSYNHQQGLKEWKPQPSAIVIRESLQKLKLKSPLHRLLTASRAT